MRTVFVIGGGGFIGRHVCRRFHREGWRVLSVGRGSPDEVAEHITTDLPDPRLASLFAHSKPDLCVHCAGRASVALSVTDPHGDFLANSVLTAWLLENIRQHARQCAFVTISSASVYGNPDRLPIREEDQLAPVSSYGYHKLMEELLCREYATLHGLRTASLRVFSAYGAELRRQVVWDIACKTLTTVNGVVTLRGTGTESRDFVHGQDVALSVQLVAERGPLHGEAYNVACGIEVPIKELAQYILTATDSNAKLDFDGSAPDGYAHRWHADISKLRNLGFVPRIDFESGLQEVVSVCRRVLGLNEVCRKII